VSACWVPTIRAWPQVSTTWPRSIISRGRYVEAEPLYRPHPGDPREVGGAGASARGHHPQQPGRGVPGEGRWSEAAAIYPRAIAIVERSLGPDHPTFGQPPRELRERPATRATGRERSRPMSGRATSVLATLSRTSASERLGDQPAAGGGGLPPRTTLRRIRLGHSWPATRCCLEALRSSPEDTGPRRQPPTPIHLPAR
jgi:hypothetical protein